MTFTNGRYSWLDDESKKRVLLDSYVDHLDFLLTNKDCIRVDERTWFSEELQCFILVSFVSLTGGQRNQYRDSSEAAPPQSHS